MPSTRTGFKGGEAPTPKVSTQDSRLLITPLVLLKIKSILERDPHNYDNILLWAACCLGFFAVGGIHCAIDAEVRPSLPFIPSG